MHESPRNDGSGCQCSAEAVAPWQRPLLANRAGGRLGAIRGYMVDGMVYPDRRAGAEAQLRRDGVEEESFRTDALGVELVIDGGRVIETEPGRWVDASSGLPWRPRRPRLGKRRSVR